MLYDGEYYCYVINAIKQIWEKRPNFSCLGMPKQQSLLVYICDCNAVYTTIDGQKIHATSGDIVYTPQGSEYSVDFCGFKNGKSSLTIGINFHIFAYGGEKIYLSNRTPVVIGAAGSHIYRDLFFKVADYSNAAVQPKAAMKSAFYEILSNIGLHFRCEKISKTGYDIIAPAIRYLEEDETLDLSINEIAALCNISEVYFRKVFKQYSGKSPRQFIIDAKMEKAKNYLAHESLSVSQIAEICGFYDSAYFCRLFKRRYGVTPGMFKDKFDLV